MNAARGRCWRRADGSSAARPRTSGPGGTCRRGRWPAGAARRSPLRDVWAGGGAAPPLDIWGVLAGKYPATPSISYIPALAWINTLRLASIVGDETLRAKVHAQVQPWLSGDKPVFGDRIQLTSAAGTMVFAEIAKADPGNAAARRLALEGAEAASRRKDDGLPQYGQGW